MNKLDKDYQALLQDIMDNGVSKSDRTGTGTLSVFGRQIRHKMSDGFPLLTTKKMYWKGIVTELIWFLRGDTNIKYLVDNDCHIWDGDTYKNYRKIAGAMEEPDYNIHVDDPNQNCTRLMTQEEFINNIKTDDEFAKKWGDLGKIYGKQWRRWKVYKYESGTGHLYSDVDSNGIKQHIDQIANLINDLKTNPDSRRLMVSAWNPSDLPLQVLPPCHYGFQVYTRELTTKERMNLCEKYWKQHNLLPLLWRVDGSGFMYDEIEKTIDRTGWDISKRAISLMYNARSQDVPLGTPFNISSYALLLVILGKMVNMVPDELIANMGDCHIYSNQIDGVKKQLTREPYQLPTLKINSGNENWHLLDLDEVLNTLDPSFTFKLENYQSHPTIKLPLSN